MSTHIFVDETKQRDFLLVAAVVVPGDLDVTRALMRSLVLKGQYRVHMKKESDARKRAIAAAICDSGVQAVVYDAGNRHSSELHARAACLRALVADAAVSKAAMLVLEQDDSLRWWDDQRLIELTREYGCRETLQYRHQRASAEQLLSIPDAIAWCWAKGGDWRRRIEPIVTTVQSV